MEVKYQVFISSTFADLKEERRKVSESILNMGHIPVGMEVFNASDVSQWQYIKDRIDECDYYVVIIAERYGSEKDGKSYTQLEYEYAAEKGIPIIAFLLSDDARKKWPAGSVETKKIAKINRFRSICEGKIVKYWENPDDLASKVFQSLSHEMKRNPRTGWMRADALPSRQVLQELAALSEERRALQDRVTLLESSLSEMKIPMEYRWKVNKLKSLTVESVLDYVPTNNSVDLYSIFGGICEITKNWTSATEIKEFVEEYADYKLDNYDFMRVMDEFMVLDLLDSRADQSGDVHSYNLSSAGKMYIMYSEIMAENDASEAI